MHATAPGHHVRQAGDDARFVGKQFLRATGAGQEQRLVSHSECLAKVGGRVQFEDHGSRGRVISIIPPEAPAEQPAE